ncbi:ORF6N domain-containing protein [Prosthecochloris sp.]|uniref:ORF6N domain-containing protein n=2 Tax=unclassified Prosthecochloris TaxID=2632826 RepID=UPI0033905A96
MESKSTEFNNTIVSVENIQSMIYTIRDVQVMLDSDLARVYGVEVKRLTEQVKRNINRFPDNFRFQLTPEEFEKLRSQIATLETGGGRGKHRKYYPYVFTEQGVSMLSAVLRSETAVMVSIKIINAFVEMRRFLQQNADVFTRLDSVERRQIIFEAETEKNFEKIFKALESDEPSKQGIFYNGQVYDAYTFACDLVRRARKSLIVVDNYVDDSVLTLLSKRKNGVSATIYTKTISRQLALDLKKYNQQYPPIFIEVFKDTHDRFLIIDRTEIYHIGASLKDLGKKWFAFSRFESSAVEMLKKMEVKK